MHLGYSKFVARLVAMATLPLVPCVRECHRWIR